MNRVRTRIERMMMAPARRPARRMAGAPVVFTHVPKAAGTALVQAIETALAPRRPLVGFDDSLFGGFCDFASLVPEERARIYLHDADYPADADFVGGHFCYRTTRRLYPDAAHLIVLREPISRLMSQWLYWRAQSDDALEGLGSWGDVVRLARRPLHDFLAQPKAACQTDNACLRALLHGHPLVPPDDFIHPHVDAILLKAARQALKQYVFADILEDPAMLRRLSGYLGVPLALPRVNETAPIPPALRTGLADIFAPEAMESLKRLSRLDARLWSEIARKRLTRVQVQALHARIRLHTTARHAALMAPA
jgi:hypothetical protein